MKTESETGIQAHVLFRSVPSRERERGKQERAGEGAKQECGLSWRLASTWPHRELWSISCSTDSVPPFAIHLSVLSWVLPTLWWGWCWVTSQWCLLICRRLLSRKGGSGELLASNTQSIGTWGHQPGKWESGSGTNSCHVCFRLCFCILIHVFILFLLFKIRGYPGNTC